MPSFEIDYEEDLVPRIRDLINGYDKDSILKEYLQNADDSGATEVIVTFDKQKYPYLNNTEYESAGGTSLLIYNNSFFRDKDFKSIVKISDQGKENDASSTGRFGQGFSSSFSISDLPSFVSNGRAYWFDVLRTSVSKNKSKSIQGWEKIHFNEIKQWLKTFELGGFDFESDFKGTIFRLPLRNEITASKSRISDEIFSFNDFLKWVDEWKKHPDNLLFLRHIHKLTLQEVDENGMKKIHLQIKTENIQKIEQINNIIQNEFKDNLIETCEEWKKTNEELPFDIYEHKLEIDYLNREDNVHVIENRSWKLVNGLFRGENNCLINQAIKVLKIKPQKRKVLPWAGVAIEIDKNGTPIQKKYKYFTFLPLPIKSNYPVHIHGWFDINSKRTEIISNGSGYNLETVIEWNKLLLEQGVGKAWAILIDSIKSKQKNYYSFWAKKTEFDLNDHLMEGFYQNISRLNCFNTVFKSKKTWKSPIEETLYYFKDEKNSILVEAFQEEFPLVMPRPNNTILENLENIDAGIQEITPANIRRILLEKSMNMQFPTTLNDMNVSFLHKKKWFIEVLKYCADNGEDYTLIDGLPLEMTLNKKIYKVGDDTFFSKAPDLKLFQDLKYIFLDTEIVDCIGETDTLPDSWLEPTFINKIKQLSEYWEKINISKEWLSVFVDLISNSNKDEYDEVESKIKELNVVYQENEEYYTLKSDITNFSPFMPRKEDLKNNLKYYQTIEMNTVHHEYIDIYKPLLKCDGMITEVSPYTLIQHLLLLDDYSFYEGMEITEFLLGILTENLSWFDTLTKDEKNILYSMPFIRTTNENMYSRDTSKKLFLPTNFPPPDHIKSLEGKYELLAVERDTNLYELYKKMNIEEQSVSNYIQEIIIPFLENSDDTSTKKEVLAWLIKGWDNFRHDIDETLIYRLQRAYIIPVQYDENKSHKACDVYLPNISLPAFLKDDSYMPIVFKDKDIQKYWISFLQELGASNVILSQHVILKIEQIIKDDDKNEAIILLNYIANNFELFESMHYNNKKLLDVMKKYSWLPVEYPNDILKPSELYTNLRCANELILDVDLKLVGGVYYPLDRKVKLGKKDEYIDYSAKDMARLLGLIVDLPNEAIFFSFKELQKLSPASGQVLNYAKEFYKYLGWKHLKDIAFDVEDTTIIVNQKWVAPKFIYQQQINLTGIYTWSNLVNGNVESNLAKGLILLGVEEKPTMEFFVEYLESLPLEQKLNTNQLQDAKTLLNEIQQNDYNLFAQYDTLPILTRNNELILSTYLYINDLPAYKNAKDKNDNLQFCQTQFERLSKRLGTLELSKNYESKLYHFVECDSIYQIHKILEKNSFKESILRLLYKEQKIEDDQVTEEFLYNVLPAKLIFVSELVIEYSINETFLFRSDETTYDEDGTLYILDQDDEDDMIEVISKYICDAKDLSRDSFACIERILRKKMNKNEINDFLEKRKIGDLPRKLEYDDMSMYNKNTITSIGVIETDTDIEDIISETAVDTNDESSIEIDEDLDSIMQTMKDMHASSENHGATSTTKSKKTSDIKELAAPTKPKKSSDITELAAPTKAKTSNTDGKHNQNSTSLNTLMGGQNSYTANSDSKSTNEIVSSNNRMPVYLGHDKKLDETKQKTQTQNAKEIGDKGEYYVLDHASKLLLSPDNHFEKATVNNKGCDIYEKDKNGKVVRYIEIKTLTGKWGDGGVSVSEYQFKFAKELKDKWYLFVVENINSSNTKIHRLKNPVLQATNYMFDSSWKQLAEGSENNSGNVPKIGDKYIITMDETEKEVQIVNVNKKGPVLFKVELLTASGQIIEKKFNKSWRKV